MSMHMSVGGIAVILCAHRHACARMEANRYIFGEIMYGGHITDDWDRRLCNAYLAKLCTHELLEGGELSPGFTTASPTLNHKAVVAYIDDAALATTPQAFGLHPNAEIGFRLAQSESMFKNITELQPRTASGSGGMSMQEQARVVLDEVRMPRTLYQASMHAHTHRRHGPTARRVTDEREVDRCEI